MKTFRIITFILLISWMILIFSFSNQNATISSSTSGSVIQSIAKIVIKDYEQLPESNKKEIIASYQFIARKTAHFTIYFSLGIFAYLSVITYNKKKMKFRVISSACICLIYSISDEIHQIFIPGRACQFRDVCIDFCGSLLAILLLTMLTRLIKPVYRIVKAV